MDAGVKEMNKKDNILAQVEWPLERSVSPFASVILVSNGIKKQRKKKENGMDEA